MNSVRLNQWISLAPANAPWLISGVLVLLIAIELARMVIAGLGGSPVQSPQPVRPGTAAQRAPAVDVQKLVGSHLFGIAAEDPGSAADPSNAPQSSANLMLAGTIATEDPKHGVAIISDGGPSKVYTVGQNVGGAVVHSVYLDRVLLNRGGALEALILPRELQNGAAGRGPSASRVPAGAADPRTAAAVENIRRMVQQDPGILNEVMRTVPSYDNKAGRLRGFRAYPGRNRLAFAKLGLKPGDLVTAINGTPLDDPQRSQDVFNTIQTSDRATVTIERSGQRQEITLNIAQVASQAAKDLEIDSGGSGAPSGGQAAPPPPPENSND
jgi:general secretion pathway protein C